MFLLRKPLGANAGTVGKTTNGQRRRTPWAENAGKLVLYPGIGSSSKYASLDRLFFMKPSDDDKDNIVET